MNLKLSYTLNILKYHFCLFRMTFMECLHIAKNMTNNKENVMESMNQVQDAN